MTLIKGLQQRRSWSIALVIACVTVGGIAVWHASKLPAGATSAATSMDKQNLQERLQKGVGSEVRFASTFAKPAQIAEAVDSTADFMYRRAGVRMSDETKKQLVEAETNVLAGRTKYITIEELTDNLTAGVVDRLGTITDEEIRWVTEVSTDENGQISSRATGKWGVLTTKDLIQQAKAGREWSRRGDSTLQSALRSMIEGEVNDRISMLGAALPNQFGQADAKGITPTQAVLIAYSVAADDQLTDSQSDIDQMLMQKRIDSGQTREQKKAQKHITGRPYGPHGFLHPSAPQLFLNRAAIDKILNPSEGGKK